MYIGRRQIVLPTSCFWEQASGIRLPVGAASSPRFAPGTALPQLQMRLYYVGADRIRDDFMMQHKKSPGHNSPGFFVIIKGRWLRP